MKLLSVFIFFIIFTLSFAQNETIINYDNLIKSKKPIVISDKFYWAYEEGNLGISIFGKFNTPEKLAETFNLLKEVGTLNNPGKPYGSKKWLLSDILVSVNYDGGGYVAEWKVSGPAPIIKTYLDNLLRGYKDKSVFYDFGYDYINFKPTAYFEREGESSTYINDTESSSTVKHITVIPFSRALSLAETFAMNNGIDLTNSQLSLMQFLKVEESGLGKDCWLVKWILNNSNGKSDYGVRVFMDDKVVEVNH